MFVPGGHLLYEGACPRRATVPAAAAAPSRPRCHPEPGPDFVGDVGEGSAVRPARRVRAVLAARCKNGLPTQRPHPATTRSNLSKMNTYARRAANPRRMCTYKSLDLKPPGMNTYQEMGEGESYCYPAATIRVRRPKMCLERVAMRLNGRTHSSPLPAFRDESLCYALCLEAFSAGPSAEVQCES